LARAEPPPGDRPGRMGDAMRDGTAAEILIQSERRIAGLAPSFSMGIHRHSPNQRSLVRASAASSCDGRGRDGPTMRGERLLSACLLVILMMACGGSGAREPAATGQLGACITASDGFASCDEYCASVYGNACISNLVLGMAPSPDDACAVSNGAVPPVLHSGAYAGWNSDRTCAANRAGVPGAADVASSSCDRAAFEDSSLGPAPLAIRCCCGF
jgi:hypothetical protein